MAVRVDVVVIGAGLAGLAATIDLQRAGLEVRLVERSSAPGGRVATDLVDGFRLDRGFQVLNTAYPQVRRRLDLDALDVRTLTPGALVSYGGRLRRVSNPLRQPRSTPRILTDKLLPLPDLVRLGLYSARTVGPRRAMSHRDKSALDAFARAGLGGAATDRFLKPFLTGVLLEDELDTSRRFVDLVWRSFVRGQSVLPARGMGDIGRQLAGQLREGTLQLDTTVTNVGPTTVETDTDRYEARAVVVATDPGTAANWLGSTPPAMRDVTTYYFSPTESPLAEATIVLDGEGKGPLINTVVLTEAVPEYAPPGRTLVSASVLGPPINEVHVQRHLTHLYSEPTNDWPLVATVHVRGALPAFLPGAPITAEPMANGMYVAGDHRATPSIQGALASGTAIARRVLVDLKTPTGVPA